MSADLTISAHAASFIPPQIPKVQNEITQQVSAKKLSNSNLDKEIQNKRIASPKPQNIGGASAIDAQNIAQNIHDIKLKDTQEQTVKREIIAHETSSIIQNGVSSQKLNSSLIAQIAEV